LSAVDDGVGEIVAALERVGIRENTCIFFMSDNGPCRHSRNWLDGRTDPYYGGSAGKLKGNKGSVYEGGIRVPGIFSWPGTIPADRVINEVGIAMDIFPTFLRAAGGDSSNYELDGLDILPVLAEGRPTPHADIFWERRDQTALRRGKWKLVLNGELVEGAPPEDAVHLADLEADMGERHNLKDQDPDLTAEMKDAALTWRREIDRRWLMEWKPRFNDPYILAKAVNLEEFE
jgi:arylsulfatase A-like enzyme